MVSCILVSLIYRVLGELEGSILGPNNRSLMPPCPLFQPVSPFPCYVLARGALGKNERHGASLVFLFFLFSFFPILPPTTPPPASFSAITQGNMSDDNIC